MPPTSSTKLTHNWLEKIMDKITILHTFTICNALSTGYFIGDTFDLGLFPFFRLFPGCVFVQWFSICRNSRPNSPLSVHPLTPLSLNPCRPCRRPRTCLRAAWNKCRVNASACTSPSPLSTMNMPHGHDLNCVGYRRWHTYTLAHRDREDISSYWFDRHQYARAVICVLTRQDLASFATWQRPHRGENNTLPSLSSFRLTSASAWHYETLTSISTSAAVAAHWQKIRVLAVTETIQYVLVRGISSLAS